MPARSFRRRRRTDQGAPISPEGAALVRPLPACYPTAGQSLDGFLSRAWRFLRFGLIERYVFRMALAATIVCT
ncbi:MAG: hypothetical protein J0H41_19175, partial [Rhizobiales bacterium]|nr:hypothetical protein [Hyphomicrobiales bacterium]